jgi:Ni/Fe-hydrogenase subunit HybB-like protein
MRKVSNFDPGREQIQTLAKTVAYAICINVFFFLCEVFVAFYSNIPGHMHAIKYLFVGLEGHASLVPWMWSSMVLMLIGIILTVNPATRKNEMTLAAACAVIIIGTWIDKGLGMISGGFVPNPLHEITEYAPSLPEIGITLGVYAIGALVLTVLYKIVVGVKEEIRA